jgi:hypothetical protein
VLQDIYIYVYCANPNPATRLRTDETISKKALLCYEIKKKQRAHNLMDERADANAQRISRTSFCDPLISPSDEKLGSIDGASVPFIVGRQGKFQSKNNTHSAHP